MHLDGLHREVDLALGKEGELTNARRDAIRNEGNTIVSTTLHEVGRIDH